MENVTVKTTLLIFLSALLINCSAKHSKNKIDSFVMDYEELLTETQEAELNRLYTAHEKKTSNQIVLITTADYGDKSDIIEYATKTANQLGVGQKDKDNGLLIVLSKAKRETRIATGYGTERVLKDHLVKKIIDSLMIPEFKKGNFYEGIHEGSKAIITFLELPENEIK